MTWKDQGVPALTAVAAGAKQWCGEHSLADGNGGVAQHTPTSVMARNRLACA
jgi:hypothetical protein